MTFQKYTFSFNSSLVVTSVLVGLCFSGKALAGVPTAPFVPVSPVAPISPVSPTSSTHHELPRVASPILEVVSPLNHVNAQTQNSASAAETSNENPSRFPKRPFVRRHLVEDVAMGPTKPQKLQVMIYTSTHMDSATTERLIDELKRFRHVVEPAVMLAGMPLRTNEQGLEVVDHDVFNTFLAPFIEAQIPVAIDPTALNLLWEEIKSTRTGDLSVDRAPRLPIVKVSGFGDGTLLVEGSASLIDSLSLFVNQMDTNTKIQQNLGELVKALTTDGRFAELVSVAKTAGVQ